MKKLIALVLCCIMLSVTAAFAGSNPMTVISIPQTEAYCLQAGIDVTLWAEEEHAPYVAAALVADYESVYGSIPGGEIHGASVIVSEVDGVLSAMAYMYLNDGQTLIIIQNVSAGMTFATVMPLEVLAGKEPSEELYEEMHQSLIGNYTDPANCRVTGEMLAAAMGSALPAGDVTGKWAAPLADAVAELEVNADGTATLTIVANVYSLTWTLDGTSLVFAQNGAELPAKYDGATISLPLGTDVLMFSRVGGQSAGDITGTWNAPLADAVAVLVINADGTAALTIVANVYSLTWTLDGTSLILEQNGVELPAEYDGTKILLPLGTDVLVFTR